MTHANCGLRLCTVTINSDNILTRACLGRYSLTSNMLGHISFPHLSIKPGLDMTSFKNYILFIAMNNADCGLILSIITKIRFT